MTDDRNPTASVHRMVDLVTPMAIRVAATLRIADHIRSGMTTAAALAEATHADPDTLVRLLRHLGRAGLLVDDGSGSYTLTERGDVLRDDHPSDLRSRLDIEGPLGRADLSFVQLLHAVRTGEAAFPMQFGRSFWDDLASDSNRTSVYDVQMGRDVAAWVPAIVAAYDWGSLGHVVDVGGGNGSLLTALLTSYPDLRGTVFEQLETAAAARGRLEAAGLADRGDAVSGSFFDRLPAGADGYLLTAVIHDWDDESASVILRRCREAAGTNGRVFVIEKIGTDGVSPGSEMDLRMLAYLGGQERSRTELIALTEGAGLRVIGVYTTGAITIVQLATA